MLELNHDVIPVRRCDMIHFRILYTCLDVHTKKRDGTNQPQKKVEERKKTEPLLRLWVLVDLCSCVS